jgi:hypothetical protein
MIGPGKYDDLCTAAREAANAVGVILLVFGGDKGGGFSCQTPPEITRQLPDILRSLAEQIEKDVERDISDLEKS